MEYQPEVHGDLLERIRWAARARSLQRVRVRDMRLEEHSRHRQALAAIRSEYDEVHINFSELLNEAERMKLPTAAISEAVGLSRARLSQIRRERKV